MPEERVAQCQAWIRELVTAIKGVQFYPLGHPKTQKTVTKLGEISRNFLADQGSSSLMISQGKIMFKNGFLPETPHTKDLVSILHGRGIMSIGLHQGIEDDEIQDFLVLLAGPEAPVREAGGLVPYLQKTGRNFRNISLTPLDYSALLEGNGEDDAVATEGDLWESLFDSLMTRGGTPLPPEMVSMVENALLHPEQLAKVMEDLAPGKKDFSELAVFIEAIVEFYRRHRPEEGELVGQQLSLLVSSFPAELKREVLLSAEKRSFPLIELIAPFIDQRERAFLMVALAKTFQAPGGRLANLFLRLGCEDAKEASQVVNHAFGGPGMDAESLKTAAETMGRLLTEAQKDFVGQSYSQTLSQVMLASGQKTIREVPPELENALADLSDQVIQDDLIGVTMELFDQSADPESRQEIIKFLNQAVSDYLENGDLDSAKKVISFLMETFRRDPRGNEAAVIQVFLGEKVIEKTLAAVRELGKSEQEDFSSLLGELVALNPEEALSHLAGEEDRSSRHLLINALGKGGGNILPVVVAQLKDPRWYVVRNMVTIIREINPPNLVEALSKVTRHSDPRVKREVIKTAGLCNYAASWEIIQEYLRDGDDEIREAALYYAGLNQNPNLVPPLVQTVKANLFWGFNFNMKRSAIQALGRFDSPISYRALDWVLSRRPICRREQWRDLKEAAVTALEAMATSEAREILEKHGRLKFAGQEQTVGETPSLPHSNASPESHQNEK